MTVLTFKKETPQPDVREMMTAAGGRIARSASIAEGVVFETPVDVADNVTIYGRSRLGAFTYVNVGCVLYNGVRLGKFCSLGRGVELGLAQHAMDHLSTHPFVCVNSLFSRIPEYADMKRVPWRFHPETKIGNDVWFGAKASVVAGVTIGDGAVIAAGAVVTKDVEPYTIVGGVSAKPIRKRFSDPIIEQLLALKWWDLPLAELRDLPFDNIEACVERLQDVRKRLPVPPAL